jgi:hypothetical protein
MADQQIHSDPAGSDLICRSHGQHAHVRRNAGDKLKRGGGWAHFDGLALRTNALARLKWELAAIAESRYTNSGKYHQDPDASDLCKIRQFQS